MQITDALEVVSAAGTAIMTFVGLRVQSAVSAMRADSAEERAKDRDDMRTWIESRFLPSREADTRLVGLEQKSEDHERRLRRVEQRRRRDQSND